MSSMFLSAASLILMYTTLQLGQLPPAAISADDQQCSDFWFGENCSYACYCFTGPQDCDYNGTCQTRGCKDSRFGPGCQYVDLLYIYGAPWNPAYITDADDHTCSEDDVANSVTVSLSKPVTFLWFRIIAKNPVHLKDFSVKINSLALCTNEKRFKVSETVMDISCDTSILLRHLELRGQVAQTLCSIRISGGRNVALRQPTAQSSTSSKRPEASGPELAVDGDTNQDYLHGSCTQTEQENQGPSWRVFFSLPHIIIRAEIYNRIRGNDRNFLGNTIETYDKYQNLTSYSRIAASDPRGIYEVMLLSRELVSMVVINRPPNIGLYDRVLNLCEVFLFGERLCPEDKFGLFCDQTCMCANDEICNVVTGACATGCPLGKYGFNCADNCSETCHQTLCKSRFGGCVTCVPGYTGLMCNKECPSGMYGQNCAYVCSPHCQEVCDFQTGVCSCNGSFSQPLCQDCLPGFFGDNCSQSCPDLCHLSACERVTGACFRCPGLRVGNFCEECPPNYYGSMCYTKCSAFCANGTCDKENGGCSGCTGGYFGRGCTLAPSRGIPWKYVITLPAVGLFIFLGTVLLLRKRRDSYDSEATASSYENEDL